jgi:hypothetical protein
VFDVAIVALLLFSFFLPMSISETTGDKAMCTGVVGVRLQVSKVFNGELVGLVV